MNLSKNIVFYEKKLQSDASEVSFTQAQNKEVQNLEKVINELVSKHNYSKKGAFSLLKRILSAKY